jgi:SAM-dependent methyltransferase
MDAQNPNIEKASFDLLIATCLLIHLNDPEKALNEWRNMVKQGGELVIYVPCDPGLLIRVSRNLIVRTKNRKHGCEDYELICAREHKSSLHVLDRYIKNIFNADSIKISTWPIPKLYLWNLNLAYIYTIKKL